MPVTKVGVVYYKDDPDKRVFRVVHPTRDDSELLEPPTTGNGFPYLKEDGFPHSWTSLGTDPNREAVLEVLTAGDPRAKLTGAV